MNIGYLAILLAGENPPSFYRNCDSITNPHRGDPIAVRYW
ncbi:hypothetical protein D777_02411 [Marinobacter nitratireducens]|uniref:Uncharacterized protein n=1 Tax=Marinobacter nitratireducens TaxID=1137280 RepID=A0A072MYH1_9GAMM|nr:hypothetical protein D777_02411 [Marinobacter nitratireducens]